MNELNDDDHVLIVCLTDDPFLPPARGAFGGSVNVMFNLGAFLLRRGKVVSFIVTSSKKKKDEVRYISEKCNVHDIAVHGENGEPVAYHEFHDHIDTITNYCFEQFSKNIPKTIISYNWNSGLVACNIAAQWRIPHLHFVLSLSRARRKAGDPPQKLSPNWTAAEIRIFNESDHVIAASSAETDEIKFLYPECKIKNITCIHLGIDSNVFSPRPRSISDYIRWSANCFTKRAAQIP
jgi:hypothetical protein